jgi:hypothetical protein
MDEQVPAVTVTAPEGFAIDKFKSVATADRYDITCNTCGKSKRVYVAWQDITYDENAGQRALDEAAVGHRSNCQGPR